MTLNPTMPPAFAQRWRSMNGEDGGRWVTGLPALVAACADRYQLESVGNPSSLSYNYVVAVKTLQGTLGVLKLGFPDDDGFRTEANALALYDGRGAVRLLECDISQGVMLLERVDPGRTLHQVAVVDDQRATTIVANVMGSLWRQAPREHSFPTAQKWGEAFARYRVRYGSASGPIAPDVFDKAERVFQDLCSSQTSEVVLHGDLHYDNILEDECSGWLAIDPKGVVGEREYEIGALLRNQEGQADTEEEWQEVLSRRIATYAEHFGFDRERLVAWGFSQAVLSALWSLECQEDIPLITTQCVSVLGASLHNSTGKNMFGSMHEID